MPVATSIPIRHMNFLEGAITHALEIRDALLGDNRVEVEWGEKADGTKVFRSNFAPGADDKKLKL